MYGLEMQGWEFSGWDPLCQGCVSLCTYYASEAPGAGLASASLGFSIGYLHLLAVDDVFLR